MDIVNKNKVRGSEWRKWDLHIHTKGTNKNDQFTSVDFDAFCIVMFKKAIEKDIKAIGITDYFSIENYKKVTEFQKNINTNNSFTDEEKNEISKIFILPNVELRMLPVTDKGRLINIHCIFNTSFVSDLDNNFFNRLNCVGENYLMNRQGIISLGESLLDKTTDKNALYKKGIDHFVVSPEDLKELLASNLKLRENTIIVVSNSSNDGVSAIQKHYDSFENENGSLDVVRKTIYEMSDCIFSANENDTKFFAGKDPKYPPEIVKQKFGSVKPCIHGSDAHSENKLFSPDNNRYCWIKADLTFEGLKQILYEPDERIKIQSAKPDEKSHYQVIDSVLLEKNEIWKETIYLNENLNTIIGGRSTGKSTLLKSIAKNINKIEDHLSGVTVKWKDDNETSNRDIDFFRQGYMYEIAKNDEEINKLIQNIIRNREEYNSFTRYETANSELKKSLSKSILEVFQLQTDIEELKKKLKEKGDKKGVETEIKRLEVKNQELNKNEEITTQDLDTYQNNLLKEIAKNKQLINQYEHDVSYLFSIRNLSIIDTYYINKFDTLLSPLIKGSIIKSFNKFKNDIDANWVKRIEDINGNFIKQKQEYQNEIKITESFDVFKKCTQYFSKNEELNDIQIKLKEENSKLQEIKGLEEKLKQLNSQKTKVIKKIVEDHNSYHSNTQSLVQDFKIEHDEVKITANNSCKKEEIRLFLENRLNQRGNERKEFIDSIINQYESKTSDQIKIFLSKALNKEIDYKNDYTNQNVVTEFVTTNWFNISFEISYQDDVFSKMSEGKQAFVILKLLLEFSMKECPILIDQPEDNLDNRAIYSELVKYLKIKKKKRQIILVTHNPNVVVSADAENVIVANQDGTDSKNKNGIKFQYINGSLEHTKQKDSTNNIILESQGIREHVCEILEGGMEAFRKREQKYGFKK